MKIAILNHCAHKPGDLLDSLLLRVLHLAGRFLRADLFLLSGKVAAEQIGEAFWTDIRTSLDQRKVGMKILVDPSAGGPANLPYASGKVIPFGEELISVSELFERVGEVPDFHQAPHAFLVFETDGGRIANRREHRAALPDEFTGKLTDWHVHTNLAYCSENMTIPSALAAARETGLRQIHFSEHSGHLYYTRDEYWSGKWEQKTGDLSDGGFLHRGEEYAAILEQNRNLPGYTHGFELDVDSRGTIVLSERDSALSQKNLGAVHFLTEKKNLPEVKREFLFRTEALLRYGIPILAHPFRIFRWGCGIAAPEDLFRPLAELLKKYNTAAEINCHCNFPYPEFCRICLEKGVKFSLGSDAHNLYEVGFFHPHLEFLKELGIYDRLDEFLI